MRRGAVRDRQSDGGGEGTDHRVKRLARDRANLRLEQCRDEEDPEARDQLTAQELQIAQLAAEGLSNREIGQRLFLSHRTISTHLYRVFPKLGITSRGELSAALAPRSTDT